jgi:hypothetical protein
MSLKDKIRAKTKRNEGNSIDYLIASLNPTLREWYGYFQHAHRFTFSRQSMALFAVVCGQCCADKSTDRIKDVACAIINNGRMPSLLILGYSQCQTLINWRANPDEETTDGRARAGKPHTGSEGGDGESRSLPLSNGLMPEISGGIHSWRLFSASRIYKNFCFFHTVLLAAPLLVWRSVINSSKKSTHFQRG